MYEFRQKKDLGIQGMFTLRNCILFIASLTLLIFFKGIFMLSLVIFLDFIMSTLKNILKIDMPIDFIVLGIIFFSFHKYPFWYTLVLIAFMIANRMIYARIEPRHIIKMGILLIIGLVLPIFSALPFMSVFLVAYLLKFILEHIFMMLAFQELQIFRVPNQMIQIGIGYVIFMLPFF